VQVLQSQNAGAPKPTNDDQKTKFKQMDNDGAQHVTSPRLAPSPFQHPLDFEQRCSDDIF